VAGTTTIRCVEAARSSSTALKINISGGRKRVTGIARIVDTAMGATISMAATSGMIGMISMVAMTATTATPIVAVPAPTAEGSSAVQLVSDMLSGDRYRWQLSGEPE